MSTDEKNTDLNNILPNDIQEKNILIKSSRPSWDKTFTDILFTIAQRSCCVKYKVSSILVRDQQILSIGYNGTLPNAVECNQYWSEWFYLSGEFKKHLSFDNWIQTKKFKEMHSEWSKINELHAEANVLASISKKEVQQNDVIYSMYAPCENCAKSIVYHGIKNVKYIYEYSRPDGINILKNNGVNVTQINLNT